MRLLRSSVVFAAACSAPQARPAPQCNADAKIVIGGQDDVAAAAGCLTIESLAIRTGAPLDLTPLHKLHVILGELRVGPSVALDELRLPELHSAATIAITGNHNLKGVFLPKLTTANAITIANNVELTSIAMPKLANVRGDFTISDHAELASVQLSSLAAVDGELGILANPHLTIISVEKLERAKSVKVENNTDLPVEIADALRTKTKP
jgi:hypothetical protein